MQPANTSESLATQSAEINEKGRLQGRKKSTRFAWLALCVVLALYIFSAWRIGPVSSFGVEGDDAIYLSSAKAIASGEGYILPSFPGRLSATRYPELYPLLLAGIWKLDPQFPGNVNLAVALTLAFGCLALVLIFLLLRRWPGLGDWDALGVVVLCAFTAYFLDLSGSVLTDIPFTSLVLGAVWLAESAGAQRNGIWTGHERPANQPGTKVRWAALGAGALAGLSIGFRTLGAAVVAGIALVWLMRREWRKLIWFCLAAAPISMAMAWPQFIALAHPSTISAGVAHGGNGWTQTLCYYTSYACELRMNVNSPAVLSAVVRTNLKRVFEQPGLYLFFPLGVSQSLGSLVLLALVSILAYAGIWRYIRKASQVTLPVILALYLLMIAPWPYTPDRFLVPFMPLFLGGFWLEMRYLSGMVAGNLKPPNTRERRVTALATLAATMAIGAIITVNYCYAVPKELGGLASGHRKLLTDELAAYKWIRGHTSVHARVIAYEEGLCYLYTGRPSIMPLGYRTQAFYLNDERYADEDAARLLDVARHVGASYWVVTAADFGQAGLPDSKILPQRQLRLLAKAPVVFQTADDAVRVYDVRAITREKGRRATGALP